MQTLSLSALKAWQVHELNHFVGNLGRYSEMFINEWTKKKPVYFFKLKNCGPPEDYTVSRKNKGKKAQRYQKPKSFPFFSDVFVLMDNLSAKMSTFVNELPLSKSLFLSGDTCNVLDVT